MQRLTGRPGVWIAAAIVSLASSLAPRDAHGADPIAQPAIAPRVINVTSDSQPGWLPSEALERQARKAALDYLAAMDNGHYAEAYALLADLNRKDQPFDAFAHRLRDFNARAGAVKERRVTTVTWTKDPAHAPAPGVYVALDLISRFANVDRHCGYLVLYQAPTGGDFAVMREEDDFLDNDAAAKIAKQHSQADVETTWAQVSANCPGYAQAVSVGLAPTPGPLAEVSASPVGYPTVDAALADLHSKPGVVFSTKDGWTVATDKTALTFWSFPPPGHPAYPAAVKRTVVSRAGGTFIDMKILCGASKAACDDLVRSFEQLNAQMSANLRAGR